MNQINSESLRPDNPDSLEFRSANRNSTFETIKETVADKLHAAAGVIHEKSAQNQQSPVADYANQAAGWLDNAAGYVRDVDPEKVKSDVQNEVRRNPGRSLLIAGAAGLLLGILLRR